MKYFIALINICFVFVFSNQLFSNDLQYRIKPVIEEKRLVIEMIFRGDEDGVTEIDLPNAPNACDEIVNIECSSNDGKLEVDDTSSPYSIFIFHQPGEEIRITYDVVHATEEHDIRSGYVQTETFFRFSGQNVYIIPTKDVYKERNIRLIWEDIPSEWTIANSFGIHETEQQLTLSPFSLRLGLYIGGEISLLRCGDADNAPFLALTHDDLPGNDRLISLLQTIIQSQRDFWDDHDFPHFLILIMTSDFEQGYHAEASLNAFMAFFPPLENEEDWNAMTWVLTHEHFHTWNPFKMLPTVPENFDQLAWFTEGFTEYYTAVLSYRAQTLDLKDCIKEFNQFLYSYYTSPHRNVTNDQFQKERWNDFKMQLLAYQRGCLLALLWDAKIQEATAGKHSLDDVMRDLLQKVRETNQPVLQEDILEMVGKHLGEEASVDFNRYIVEGDTIIPPQVVFGSFFEIEWIDGNGDSIPQYQIL